MQFHYGICGGEGGRKRTRRCVRLERGAAALTFREKIVMARITFLGGPETGDVDRLTWGNPHWRKHGLAHPPIVFPLNVPVEVVDEHIISKAAGNRFFRVELGDPAEQVDADDAAPGASSRSTVRAISVDSGGDCRSDVEHDLVVASIRDLVTAKETSWRGAAAELLAMRFSLPALTGRRTLGPYRSD